MINIFNDCLLNAFYSFIPSKKVKIHYKNPLWMGDFVKCKLWEHSNLVKWYYKDGKKIMT